MSENAPSRASENNLPRCEMRMLRRLVGQRRGSMIQRRIPRGGSGRQLRKRVSPALVLRVVFAEHLFIRLRDCPQHGILRLVGGVDRVHFRVHRDVQKVVVAEGS